MKPGPKEQLTDAVAFEIRKLYLDGENYKTIQQILDINANTWDGWVFKNYKDFRVNLKAWKAEKIIEKAECNLDLLLGSEDERVMADMTKFSLETLGKLEGYSKRSELEVEVTKLPEPIYGGKSNDKKV